MLRMTLIFRTFQTLEHFDQQAIRWISRRRTPALDFMMRVFTRTGNWQSWTALGVAGLLAGGTSRALVVSIAPRLILTFMICLGIKRISKRPRPNQTLQSFSTLLKNPDPYSFPSSHTACAWVSCVSLGMELGWGWPLWVGHAAAISYSRVHVGAHYPLDVLMGMLIGFSLAALLYSP